MENFRNSFIILALGLIGGLFLGGLNGMIIVGLLSVMEVSLSFDNAVVNAKVLERMSEKWQNYFLTWGMIIAVFGMRLVFPIVVVSSATGLGFFESFGIGLHEPDKYAHILHEHLYLINGFGGAFLFMIFLNFLINEEKDIHWVKCIEEKLIKIGKLDGIQITLTLMTLIILSQYLVDEKQFGFLYSGVLGIITYEVINIISGLLEEWEEKQENVFEHSKDVSQAIKKGGIGLFVYLEILDASFSFDGVVGAFALSNNFLIITIGLGVGAMFVRSLTIYLVKKGTLSDYIYLEHGAHYAIGILSIIMFINTFHEIPEVITGLVGVGFILLSLYSSIQFNKKEELQKNLYK
jgi:hypothetical protein